MEGLECGRHGYAGSLKVTVSIGMPGTCFLDAIEAIAPLREAGLSSVRYVEGWAVLEDGTVLAHAWLEHADGLFDSSRQIGGRVIAYCPAFEEEDPSALAHSLGFRGIAVCRDGLCAPASGFFNQGVSERYERARQRAERLGTVVAQGRFAADSPEVM